MYILFGIYVIYLGDFISGRSFSNESRDTLDEIDFFTKITKTRQRIPGLKVVEVFTLLSVVNDFVGNLVVNSRHVLQ